MQREEVNKRKYDSIIICVSTSVIYVFDTYIIL